MKITHIFVLYQNAVIPRYEPSNGQPDSITGGLSMQGHDINCINNILSKLHNMYYFSLTVIHVIYSYLWLNRNKTKWRVTKPGSNYNIGR